MCKICMSPVPSLPITYGIHDAPNPQNTGEPTVPGGPEGLKAGIR